MRTQQLRSDRASWFVMIALMLTAAASLGFLAARPLPVVVRYHAMPAPFTLNDLRNTADVVALLRPTGESNVHWNSADGVEWGREIGDARLPYIYHDDAMEVVRVLSGSLDERLIVVRGVGGTIGGTTISYDGMPRWSSGAVHLVYLHRVDTPTRDGTQLAWVVVADNQGVFIAGDEGAWHNTTTGIDVTSSQAVGE